MTVIEYCRAPVPSHPIWSLTCPEKSEKTEETEVPDVDRQYNHFLHHHHPPLPPPNFLMPGREAFKKKRMENSFMIFLLSITCFTAQCTASVSTFRQEAD